MVGLPHISRKWRHPKVWWGLLLLELAGTVAVLSLFGIASPNLYRTALWQVGAENGFNSSPKQILYAYANHRPLPSTPFVWSQALTDFNVAISVLSMFIMIVKAIMFSLHVWYPILSAITNAVLVGLYIASVYGQAGPDKSDPRRPSSTAWYINKSCDYAPDSKLKHYCLMAKGTFAVTVIMVVIFLANLILSVWSCIPSAAQRAADKIDVDEMQMKGGNGSDNGSETNIRVNPTSVPYTPRTLAFNTLDRQLPLRSHQDESKGKAPRFA
ncbi:hypothetical protein HYFRA_00001892 [Hymenoscyphus fraxineus]|uniref:Uncharacterized protein n=1 Tax=Hymenoscyphus fraxineus TaxID=746836 RepID=A0A9N9PMC1_9HELO|nr:hypothetical protein HYFRA_00001892 [Hymenoscyphus fraxineus]